MAGDVAQGYSIEDATWRLDAHGKFSRVLSIKRIKHALDRVATQHPGARPAVRALRQAYKSIRERGERSTRQTGSSHERH